MKGADPLIGETIGLKLVIADRGYDANRIRASLREQGIIPVIPGQRNRKRPIQYDERRYQDRWRVEACNAAKNEDCSWNRRPESGAKLTTAHRHGRTPAYG